MLRVSGRSCFGQFRFEGEVCLEVGLSGNQSPVRLGTEIVDFRGRDGRNLAPNRSKQVRRFAPHLFGAVWSQFPAIPTPKINDFRPEPDRALTSRQPRF